MEKIIRPFIKYPILGNIIIVAVFLFGYISFTDIKTTFFPPEPSRNIVISASYPGASPEEIEEAIVLKIEDNLKGLTGVERVTSTSSENACNINVRIKSGYDINVILQDVKNAVDKVSSFPSAMERLTVYRREPWTFAIDFVFSGDVSLKELKKNARRAERELLDIDGISKVNLSGFPAEEIEIGVRESDMQAFGLTFNEIVNAIRNSNIRSTGGKIKGDQEELLIRANLKGYYAEELKNHVVRSSKDGAVVQLSDVADISDRWSENPNRVYFNGKPAVRIAVNNTNDEDLFEVVDLVREYIKEFNADSGPVKAHIIRDGSKIINERIHILTKNGLMGMVLVVLFLSLSLNPTLSGWVAFGIPISFAGMLMIAPLYGLTINVMSLMAMILVLGILVDDGIVIAENIFQHHERGEKPITAAIKGTLEVFPSVVASVLTTVVIFSTFLFLEGGLGDHVRDIAYVVGVTLLASLVEAAFILPAHIAHSNALCKKDRKKHIVERAAEKAIDFLKFKVYSPALKFTMKHPSVSISITIAIFIITIGAIRGNVIKTTFFPYIERRSVSISMEMPAGTPAAVTDSIMQYIEEKVWEVNEIYKTEQNTNQDLVKSAYRRIGGGTHQGRVSATLISSEKREWNSSKAASMFRKQVGKIDGAQKLEFGGSGHWGKPVSVVLKSNNFEQLRGAKEALKKEMRQIDKLKDVIDSDPPGLREVKLNLKDKAYALGLTTSDVLSQVRSGFFGGQAQRILRGIDEVKIWVRYKENERNSITDLQNMRIRTIDGKAIPLEEIADFEIQRGVMSINHIDGQRIVSVDADLANPGISTPLILSDIRSNVMPGIIEKYPEVYYSFEGESYENQKTVNAIKKVVPAILLLMLLIVSVTFRSFSQSIIVFLLIPFSFIGVLWGHFVQGYMFSMLSTFGAIALMGIVVNDSLVLVSTVNRLLKNGYKFFDAIYEAGISRLRPVLLTSLTTIAGLAPLIFEQSHQAQFLSPMAISVAYGLLFGTLLTLLMLPALLVAYNRLKVGYQRVVLRREVSHEALEPAVKEDVFVKNQSEESC